MRRKLLESILIIVMLVLTLSSCVKKTSTESIIGIIDATENKLYEAKSLDEMQQLHIGMLENITTCLNKEHNGYRFTEGAEDYNKVMERLEKYNYVYCRALSRYNPELNVNSGDERKIVQVIALMKRMENSTLTKPEGFDPKVNDQTEIESEVQSVFPTQDEINSVNATLPILVAEGTLYTKVEYNERIKVQTFYYQFTQDVDEGQITEELINLLKARMVSALKNDANNVKRLNAGITYLYIYSSVVNKRLYQIKIDSKDIN